MVRENPGSGEYVVCPNCGKRIAIAKMNVCYIARYDCPHCGSEVLIEGDSVTAEKPPSST